MDVEDAGCRLLRHLTLLLMYLSSWQDGPDEAIRCWKTFSPEIVDELMANGFIQTRSGNKTIAFTPEGEMEAKDLLERYGFDIPNSAPLTLREIRWAISRLPAAKREDLIRELLNDELTRAEIEREAPVPDTDW